MNENMISIVFFIASVVLYFVYIWQEKRKAFLFKFFALRDRLYKAAIDGDIDENSIVFNNLLHLLNVTIAFSKEFNLSDFLKNLETEDLDKPSKNIEFFQEIKNQNEEIKDIARCFFENFLTLLIINKPPVYIIIQILVVWNKIGNGIKKKLPARPALIRELVNTIRSYDEAAEFLRTA